MGLMPYANKAAAVKRTYDMPLAGGKGSRGSGHVSLMPVTRAVLLTKEDLENFHSNGRNKDSVGSLPPLRPSGAPVTSAPSRLERPPRAPSPQPPPAQGSSDIPGLVLHGYDIRRLPRMYRDFPEPRIPEAPSQVAPPVAPSPVECSPEVARVNQFLQVSGCTALASAPSVGYAAQSSTPFEDEWSSGSEAGSDEAFDVRSYRYIRSNAAAPTASSVAPPVAVLARKWRRGVSSRTANVEGIEDDTVVAWPAVSGSEPLYVTSHGQRLLADESEDESEFTEKDERRDLENLQRIANALVEFYGLGDAKRATRLKSNVVNVVMVTEEAWKLKERPSLLEEPPMFWLRGNRVYDFHGDRGSVVEFESDLLTREVEDDAVCRSRKQGLLPFPFLPLPQKEKEEDDGTDGRGPEPTRRGR